MGTGVPLLEFPFEFIQPGEAVSLKKAGMLEAKDVKIFGHDPNDLWIDPWFVEILRFQTLDSK